jgi:hypothetical protein
MITNESEIRIALQAVLVSVLAFSGYWGCAVVVIFILLPWRPIFAAGSYLVQPLVDWRHEKARGRHEKGIGQIEKELDAILRGPNARHSSSAPRTAVKLAAAPRSSRPPLRRPFEYFKPKVSAAPAFQSIPESAQDPVAAVAIPPAIKNHVRTLPQGVFNNMDLEVEDVKFHGETADAFVRFKSSNVTGLVIRQRYLLRKSGDNWEVESRHPANGAGETPPHYPSADRPYMRLT